MFKADDYRLKIQGMREVLKEAEYALDIEHLRPRLKELEKEQENPDVWQDLEKSTKIGREIAVVVKQGGANPNENSKLKDVIAKAKAANVPNDNIERIIKKAAGETGGADYFSLLRHLHDQLCDPQQL